MISAETTIERLLEEHPQLVDFLATYHSHFERLRNRLLRKVMAPRMTIADAARIAGVPPDELLDALRRAVGEPVSPAAPAAAAAAWTAAPRPAALATLPPSRLVRVDVRDDIARGEEPFARIMAAVKTVSAGDALILRVPFEPIPLYDVLHRRGFAHWTERHAADDWSVWFYRDEPGAPAPAPPATAAAAARTVKLDVRGLEPPQPMVLVLERLDTLAADEELEVIHERRPMFLYPQLDDRGFAHETDEPAPGTVRIRIRAGRRPR